VYTTTVRKLALAVALLSTTVSRFATRTALHSCSCTCCLLTVTLIYYVLCVLLLAMYVLYYRLLASALARSRLVHHAGLRDSPSTTRYGDAICYNTHCNYLDTVWSNAVAVVLCILHNATSHMTPHTAHCYDLQYDMQYNTAANALLTCCH
jgi:hypothetical protein